MARIKSALELALERTEGVVGDKEKIEADTVIKEGKKIASSILSGSLPGEAQGLRDALKGFSGKQLGWIKEGVFQTLLANLVLPIDDTYGPRLRVVEGTLPELVADKKKAGMLLQQLAKFFQQYLDNRKTIREQLEQQFAPRLRQREVQLSQQVGSKVRLNPLQDPEFAAALQKNYAALDERYQEALAGLKDELKKMFEAAR